MLWSKNIIRFSLVAATVVICVGELSSMQPDPAYMNENEKKEVAERVRRQAEWYHREQQERRDAEAERQRIARDEARAAVGNRNLLAEYQAKLKQYKAASTRRERGDLASDLADIYNLAMVSEDENWAAIKRLYIENVMRAPK